MVDEVIHVVIIAMGQQQRLANLLGYKVHVHNSVTRSVRNTTLHVISNHIHIINVLFGFLLKLAFASRFYPFSD